MALDTEQPALDRPPEEEPPKRSDEARSEKERAWHEWMMIGVGLTGLLSILAIIVSVVALASKSQTQTVTSAAMPAAGMAMGGGGAAAAQGAGKPEALKVVMKSDTEHAKKGTDGKWHDAALPADFTVHAGDRVTLTVYNYDDMPHTWTSTDFGVNQRIPGGSENAPSKTTVTFTAPATAGQYQWWCALPCDPYSMSTDGFMRGNVTVAA
jgi:plastocyanin